MGGGRESRVCMCLKVNSTINILIYLYINVFLAKINLFRYFLHPKLNVRVWIVVEERALVLCLLANIYSLTTQRLVFLITIWSGVWGLVCFASCGFFHWSWYDSKIYVVIKLCTFTEDGPRTPLCWCLSKI